MKIRVTLIACLCALVPATAVPQALTSLASVRVGYATRKNTVNPQGELKAQIATLDAQMAEAARLGKNGELRRLYAKGNTLLAGREWTDALDYANSLVLRTGHVIADSTKPISVRLEQIYSPSINLEHTLSAHVVLRQRPVSGAAGPAPLPGAIAKDFGAFDGVSRDLRESDLKATSGTR